jgi:ABC-type oligopeptide transport system ATPase subunit
MRETMSAISAASVALPLQIDSLVKRFGELTAVDGVSLEVSDRECPGLLGPNGAGKSTTIRSIVGRVHPNQGTVRIFGHAAESAAARAAIGWVPQELAGAVEDARAAGSRRNSVDPYDVGYRRKHVSALPDAGEHENRRTVHD